MLMTGLILMLAACGSGDDISPTKHSALRQQFVALLKRRSFAAIERKFDKKVELWTYSPLDDNASRAPYDSILKHGYFGGVVVRKILVRSNPDAVLIKEAKVRFDRILDDIANNSEGEESVAEPRWVSGEVFLIDRFGFVFRFGAGDAYLIEVDQNASDLVIVGIHH